MRLPFIRPSTLRSLGVLGMNARNASYVSIYNKRSLYPLADNKIHTKRLLQEAGVSVPRLIGLVEGNRNLRNFEQIVTDYTEFVIKPARGSGGEGIIVIVDRQDGRYVRGNGEVVDLDSIKYHLQSILHGLYSLGGQADQAMIEERVHFSPLFQSVTTRGVPDIRVISFLGVPVMAMLRLPTEASHGRANLHQGAIGAGISMASGQTLSAVQKSQIVENHPDTGTSIRGIQIPDWRSILELTTRCQELIGLDYLGVDVVIDERLGPMILEVNARPGLAVQIANREGLKKRLRLVEQYRDQLGSSEERIQFAMTHF